MATGQTDRELLLALMRNPGVIPNLDPFTYPQNAPNVPKRFGQEVLEFAQALERNPNRRATGLEEVVELIGKMGVINPLKTAGSLMQLDKPTVERMAQSGVEAAKRAYDDPSGTASRLAQGAKEALLDPVGTAGELSVSDVAGGSGLLSKLAGGASLTGPALMAAMVPGSDVPRPKRSESMGFKDPNKFGTLEEPTPFGEQDYPYTESVVVEFPDGDTFVEQIKGLNSGHALERAKINFDGAKVRKATRSEELMQEQLDRGETLGALERGRLEGQMTLGPDDARARQAALVQASDEIDEKVKVGILTKDEAKAKKAPLIEEFRELNKILHEGGPEYRLRMARLDVDDSRRQLSALDALDDVEKARLDRAVQQGFNLDAFHGTKGDITEFDPGLLGVTTGAESARKGFFFSADPETAALYADLADAEKLDKKRYESFFADENSEYFDAEISNKKEQIQRAKSLGDKNAVKYLEEELQDFELEKKDYLERQVRKRDIGGGLGENIMPVKLQITNPFVRDFEGSSYREFSYNDLLKKARNEGHDGAIFRNTIDGNAITDVYVVFEPEQIKSRFATFDPEKTGSKNILASVPPVLFPLGVGAAAASYSANKEE